MEDIIALIKAEKASRVARTTLPFLDNNDTLQKGAAAQEGEVREWKGQKFRKQGGKWVPVTAQRMKAPIKDNKKDNTLKPENPSKPSGDSNKPKIDISSEEMGQLKRIKKLISSGDMDGASSLASVLSDNAKNVIPSDVWSKMHEKTSPVGSKQKEDVRNSTIISDTKERFKKWVESNRTMFDTGEHAHPDRSKAAKFLRGKVKGFVQGLKHEISHIQGAGHAIKKILSGKIRELSHHEKAALKKVGISLGLTAATLLATGGISAFAHGFGTVASHLGMHFVEHGLVETGLSALAFAKAVESVGEAIGDKDMDKMLGELVDKFTEWFEKGDWSQLANINTDTK